MLFLKDLRKKRQDLMDKEKRRQEEKVKKDIKKISYIRGINIFSIWILCVSGYAHTVHVYVLFLFYL